MLLDNCHFFSYFQIFTGYGRNATLFKQMAEQMTIFRIVKTFQLDTCLLWSLLIADKPWINLIVGNSCGGWFLTSYSGPFWNSSLQCMKTVQSFRMKDLKFERSIDQNHLSEYTCQSPNCFLFIILPGNCIHNKAIAVIGSTSFVKLLPNLGYFGGAAHISSIYCTTY